MPRPRESAERKVIRPRARIDKLDLAIHDRIRLSNELVKPWFDYRAVALEIDISTVSGARQLSIDRYAKSHGSYSRYWPHHEIEITRMDSPQTSGRPRTSQDRREHARSNCVRNIRPSNTDCQNASHSWPSLTGGVRLPHCSTDSA
jgi:hypothetical protein